jgi:hypothetical protein
MARITTTHDPAGGGHPRLVFASGGTAELASAAGGGVQREFRLLPGRTVIGSGAGCDLRLAGLADRHAEVRRDEADEYVFVQLGPPDGSRVNGQPVLEAVLHTGDRLELGEWGLSFARDEYADHGRPDGGRQGGETFGEPLVG